MTAISTRTPHPSLGTPFRHRRHKWPVCYVTMVERLERTGEVILRLTSESGQFNIGESLHRLQMDWEEVKE